MRRALAFRRACTPRAVGLALLLAGGCVTPRPQLGPLPAGYRLVYQQDFDDLHGLEQIRVSDPTAWAVRGENGARWLEQHDASRYTPPHRSPLNIALIAAPAVNAFVLEARLLQTGRAYAHRDMCVFFGFRDPAHFSYAHLATAADETAHHVQLVDAAPRRPVTATRTAGVDWGRDVWHVVRVERDATGAVAVYFDDPAEPVLTAHDRTHGGGLVGFGTFDDTGRIDDVRLWAPATVPSPSLPFAPLDPGEGSTP